MTISCALSCIRFVPQRHWFRWNSHLLCSFSFLQQISFDTKFRATFMSQDCISAEDEKNQLVVWKRNSAVVMEDEPSESTGLSSRGFCFPPLKRFLNICNSYLSRKWSVCLLYWTSFSYFFVCENIVFFAVIITHVDYIIYIYW